MHSEVLGLDLWANGARMRFRDPATGQDLLSYDEEHAARRAAENRAGVAESRAEREAAALRAALHRAHVAEVRVAELEVRLRLDDPARDA